MGYTRYWERTEKEITFRFVNDVQNILDDCKKRGIIIKDGAGENAPVVNMDKIWINGNAATGLDHETFVIDNKNTGFNFCKTARKPYDYAVRKILKIAAEQGFVKRVSSDGANRKIISDDDYLAGKY